eukprot:8477182-Pyramimonas_sp.AAC.1
MAAGGRLRRAFSRTLIQREVSVTRNVRVLRTSHWWGDAPTTIDPGNGRGGHGLWLCVGRLRLPYEATA